MHPHPADHLRPPFCLGKVKKNPLLLREGVDWLPRDPSCPAIHFHRLLTENHPLSPGYGTRFTAHSKTPSALPWHISRSSRESFPRMCALASTAAMGSSASMKAPSGPPYSRSPTNHVLILLPPNLQPKPPLPFSPTAPSPASPLPFPPAAQVPPL